MEQYGFGALSKEVDLRDYSIKDRNIDIPNEFEWQCGEVKNQGSVGSCVAHATASLEEFHNLHQGKDTRPLSVGYIYGTRYLHRGKGMYIKDALKTLQKNGTCFYEDFPYNEEVPDIINRVKESNIDDKLTGENKITSYFYISKLNKNREKLIKQTIMLNGPVLFAIKWYDDIKVKNGVIISSLSGDSGGHCVLCYGWDSRGWKIMNSWGRTWGYSGKAIYPYEYPIKEVWGDTDNEDDVVKKSDNIAWLLKFISQAINFIIKFFTNK
jgi:C1A family cysteine protease